MTDLKIPEIPIEITPDMISQQALDGIIENFILREGTDYGFIEVSYDKKAEQIKKQIDRKEIKIIFDRSTETVSLISQHEFRGLAART